MKPEHNYLIRIVRLTLKPTAVPEFMEMFEAVSPKIRSTTGCHHLELLTDASYPNIVTTYSMWEDKEALNSYRNSPLFKATWQKTRMLFAGPPVAFSAYQNVFVKPLNKPQDA